MDSPTPKDVYHAHELRNYSAEVIASAFDISIPEVYRRLAEYHEQDYEPGVVDASELNRVEEAFAEQGTSVYEEVLEDDFRDDDSVVAPMEDIDVMHDVDHLRMERMGRTGLYLAGYTDSETEPEYRYWISCIHGELYIHREIRGGLGSSMDSSET